MKKELEHFYIGGSYGGNQDWFLINGYDLDELTGDMRVKAVTYSGYRWLDFRSLWDTGYESRGGLVLYSIVNR